MKSPDNGALKAPLAIRSHEEMKPVLLYPEAPAPDEFYYMIRGGSAQRNITVWSPGTAGGEYIKAFGHYHRGDFIETYTILSGEGILMLQERKIGSDGMPVNNEVTSVTAVFVKAGDSIIIPKTAGHGLINIGDGWLATSDDSPVETESGPESAWPKHADYESIRDMRGFAYYVVEADGKPAFVKNPLYTNTPDIIIKHL